MTHYKNEGVKIVEIFPDVEDSKHILREMDPDVCCSINKEEPIRKILKKNKGKIWISAVSRYQSAIRKNFRFLEPQNYNITKIATMLVWKEDETWSYIKKNKLVYNTLFDKGHKSIGCEPFSKIINEGEDSRAGGWRGLNKDECGLHAQFNK